MGLSGSTTLDLQAIDDSFIRNVEVPRRCRPISAFETAPSPSPITIKVFLGFNDVNAINDQHTLRIDGDAGDHVTVTDFGWHESTQQQTIGNQVYDVYTNGQATLLVDHDVQVTVLSRVDPYPICQRRLHGAVLSVVKPLFLAGNYPQRLVGCCATYWPPSVLTAPAREFCHARPSPPMWVLFLYAGVFSLFINLLLLTTLL